MSAVSTEAITVVELLKPILESQPNEWIPVISALGGAVVGAIASIVPGRMLENYREKVFARRVQSSLISEVSALLKIVQCRGYLGHLRESIESLKSMPVETKEQFIVEISDHYSRIYQENAKHIGCISDDMASKIVTFYQLVDSVVQDVRAGGVLNQGADLATFEEVYGILSTIIELGNEIVEKGTEK